MGIPSLKKQIIQNFFGITLLQKEFGNNQLILVTSLGLIAGTSININEDATSTLLLDLTDQFANDYIEKNALDKDNPLNGNDGFISLTDVTIKTSHATFNLPFLNVFYDQIIGVTIGNI